MKKFSLIFAMLLILFPSYGQKTTNVETMETEIIDINLGMNHCYLIREKGLILVDAGVPKKIKSFRKQLAKHSINPKDISLVVVTHAHFDHMGTLDDIVKLTGARVAVHEFDRPDMEKGVSDLPIGNSTWGKISINLLRPFMKNIRVPGVIPDIVIKNDEYSLESFGIKGRILFTPGHTRGSLSVLLDSGDAFVGCMAHNRLPFTLRPRLPIYANDPPQLKSSWMILLEQGAKMIYPGHGKAFPAEKINKFID